MTPKIILSTGYVYFLAISEGTRESLPKNMDREKLYRKVEWVNQR